MHSLSKNIESESVAALRSLLLVRSIVTCMSCLALPCLRAPPCRTLPCLPIHVLRRLALVCMPCRADSCSVCVLPEHLHCTYFTSSQKKLSSAPHRRAINHTFQCFLKLLKTHSFFHHTDCHTLTSIVYTSIIRGETRVVHHCITVNHHPHLTNITPDVLWLLHIILSAHSRNVTHTARCLFPSIHPYAHTHIYRHTCTRIHKQSACFVLQDHRAFALSCPPL